MISTYAEHDASPTRRTVSQKQWHNLRSVRRTATLLFFARSLTKTILTLIIAPRIGDIHRDTLVEHWKLKAVQRSVEFRGIVLVSRNACCTADFCFGCGSVFLRSNSSGAGMCVVGRSCLECHALPHRVGFTLACDDGAELFDECGVLLSQRKSSTLQSAVTGFFLAVLVSGKGSTSGQQLIRTLQIFCAQYTSVDELPRGTESQLQQFCPTTQHSCSKKCVSSQWTPVFAACGELGGDFCPMNHQRHVT